MAWGAAALLVDLDAVAALLRLVAVADGLRLAVAAADFARFVTRAAAARDGLVDLPALAVPPAFADLPPRAEVRAVLVVFRFLASPRSGM